MLNDIANHQFEMATSMLVTKCVGDNFEMLVTTLAVFITNILYHFKMSVGHQHSKDVTNIEILSLLVTH